MGWQAQVQEKQAERDRRGQQVQERMRCPRRELSSASRALCVIPDDTSCGEASEVRGGEVQGISSGALKLEHLVSREAAGHNSGGHPWHVGWAKVTA